MLQPKPLKRATSPELNLASPKDVEVSLERDRALTSRARREREEIATARQRFELWREKAYLGLELVVFAIALALAVGLWLKGEETIAIAFLGGGASFGGLAALLHHRASP